ncbi:biopolymer transporter ExbD [Pseudaminobacter sp. 19-2017]|uniref:Biopolymer transporter ExbD n=1 Tax=Pseudaminobacter soli (ex Zhang et al. 2022) TaxID=2831468 RepID=A0A942E3X5_9HYPH|nr:biopolymer transporter ExbD [Pseudaminobacter soli]MBS3650130.1 biopolymer transporter ExbD [Pseudaminobacter soli]
MAGGTQRILPPPPRRWRPSFVLTSLIDIIFLLVIFFMVSSQIVPYSVLPIGPLAGGGTQHETVPQTPAGPPAVAVRILQGRVVIGGDTVEIANLPRALAELKSRGVTSILLLPGASATVQDVVTALEASKDAELANVTVLGRGGQRR